MSSFSDRCLTSEQHLGWIKKVERKGVKRREMDELEAGVELNRRGRGKRNLHLPLLLFVGHKDEDGVRGRGGWKRGFSSEYIRRWRKRVAGEINIPGQRGWNPTILLESLKEPQVLVSYIWWSLEEAIVQSFSGPELALNDQSHHKRQCHDEILNAEGVGKI